MTTLKSKYLYIAAAVFVVGLGLVGQALAESQPKNAELGLLVAWTKGAFDVSWNKESKSILSKCNIKRISTVIQVAGTGPKSLKDISEFRFYRCRKPVLGALYQLQSTSELVKQGVFLVEGIYQQPINSALQTKGEYIVKISYFNRLDDGLRQKDIKELGRLKKITKNAWSTDGVLIPTASIGINRPEELAMIYYQREGQGEMFRKNNPHVLKQVMDFNMKHTTEFTYFAGRLKR